MSGTSAAVAVGMLAGLGAAMAVFSAPPMRRPSLQQRVAPYLRGVPGAADDAATSPDTAGRTPFPTLERVAGPLVLDAAARLDRTIGGTASVRTRLERLHAAGSVEDFRVRQLVWGAGAFGAVWGFLALLAAGGRAPSPVAGLLLALIAAVAGVLACDRQLSRSVAQREDRLAAELPTVAELLALCIAAGDGPSSALERVASRTAGEMSTELRVALSQARTGSSLVGALDAMARRTGVPALARFSDGLAVAVERGTPLADVLRAQAVDAREAGRRALIEAGSRREIAMMVPVVFLILPISVVFALFPGFYGLNLSAP